MGSETQQNTQVTGLLSGLLCYTFWGFFPIYFILLRGVAADEVLADRILFAVPFGALIIWGRSQWPEVLAGLRSPRVMLWLLLSATVIALNWLVYISAVQSENTMQASLGYYINPLIYVLVGVVVLGEKLRRAQIAAVVLATIGVLVLTFYGGVFPTIAFTLAITFTIYGYARKKVQIGAMPGLFIETLLLAPFAAGWLWFLIASKDTGMEQGLAGDAGLVGLLALAGPLTVIPLLFFAMAARRLTLATLGFLQFIGPTLQFLVAVVDGEPFTLARQICFGFIWVAVAIFAFDALRHRPHRNEKPIMQVAAAQSSE
ncbi:EamA family transporter RarD [Parvularcula marina]|uniref:EamA family transporter RarD n=1 Tax=Parvularcula marina TaxID=2292771 RepID=UPI003515241E